MVEKKDPEPSLLPPPTIITPVYYVTSTQTHSCLGCVVSYSGIVKIKLIPALVFHTRLLCSLLLPPAPLQRQLSLVLAVLTEVQVQHSLQYALKITLFGK